jgi:hypothetical protein
VICLLVDGLPYFFLESQHIVDEIPHPERVLLADSVNLVFNFEKMFTMQQGR